eukprot:5549230-Ditylum_brightwellii.AAC.1
MGEFSHLESAVKTEKGLSTIKTDVINCFRDHIIAFEGTTRGDINDWNIAIEENTGKGIGIVAERIEQGLCEISTLYGLDEEGDCILKSAKLTRGNASPLRHTPHNN